MNRLSISRASFPRFDTEVEAAWCPIYLSPIMGSEERLVVAVATYSNEQWFVQEANALSRVECLYGSNAPAVAQAIGIIAANLRDDLAARGLEALLDFDGPISGAHVGAVKKTRGRSLESVAQSWMASISSLYDPVGPSDGVQTVQYSVAGVAEESGVAADRLPRAVLEFVIEQRPHALQYFRPDLRVHSSRRRNHEVVIDYDGRQMAANFGTLQAGRLSNSVALIKRRLWDLKVDRDRERSSMIRRSHEMLIKIPDRYDPEVSEAQWANLTTAREALEEQANQEELRFEAFASVADIGRRLLSFDA